MSLQTYLRHRRAWEVAMVVALVATGCIANVATETIDHARGSGGAAPAVAWLLEGSSHFALLLAFPLVVWFDGRFPLRFGLLVRHVPAHIAFSVVFSAVHVGVMYLARRLLYPVVTGESYRWDNVLGEFGYEYLKDFRTYLLVLSMIYLYRFVLLRLQGEAGFLDSSESEEGVSPPNDRFLVKKFGKEFLVRVEDIEWIESSGNYVNLHVRKKVYPLRSTMAKIADRLESSGFVRVHRQAIVNSERIEALSVGESGDGTLRLNTQATVPVSRRYRQRVRDAMGAERLN